MGMIPFILRLQAKNEGGVVVNPPSALFEVENLGAKVRYKRVKAPLVTGRRNDCNINARKEARTERQPSHA